MKPKYLGLAVGAALALFAFAATAADTPVSACHQITTDANGKAIWQCQAPPPAVSCTQPSVGADILLCNGPLAPGASPTNCGWKSGVYRCHGDP